MSEGHDDVDLALHFDVVDTGECGQGEVIIRIFFRDEGSSEPSMSIAVGDRYSGDHRP